MLSKKDRQGLWLITGVVGALAVLFIVKVNLDGKPRAGPDNCVGKVTANTVLVLDHSERITEQTRVEIGARALVHIRENVKLNERVSVFTISDLSKRTLTPVVSLCRPPDDGNRVFENPEIIRKRFYQHFEEPLRKAFLEAPGDARESPIAQALTDISLSQYLRGSSNTLLVFSDMLENTSKFSLYRCTGGIDAIAKYRESRVGTKERPELKNTMVLLNVIPRFGLPSQTLKCRDLLWTWFFGDNSGAQAGLTIEYLPGGTPMTSHMEHIQ